MSHDASWHSDEDEIDQPATAYHFICARVRCGHGNRWVQTPIHEYDVNCLDCEQRMSVTEGRVSTDAGDYLFGDPDMDALMDSLSPEFRQKLESQ